MRRGLDTRVSDPLLAGSAAILAVFTDGPPVLHMIPAARACRAQITGEPPVLLACGMMQRHLDPLILET